MSWDGFEPSTYWFSINRIYRWAIRTFGRAALSFVALPQAVFDLPRAVFEIKIPLRGIGGTAPNLNFDIFDLEPSRGIPQLKLNV